MSASCQNLPKSHGNNEDSPYPSCPKTETNAAVLLETLSCAVNPNARIHTHQAPRKCGIHETRPKTLQGILVSRLMARGEKRREAPYY